MNRKAPTKSSKGWGCLILFALPFAAVGVVMTVMVVWDWLEYAAMQRWQEVPARIDRAELEEHHGDGGTTYQATAEYTYVFQDRTFTGNRVSLHGGSDNIGSFHKRVHKELKQYQTSGKPFRCYVDSRAPANSVLYRDLRWEMIGFKSLFAVIFGAFGFGMLYGGLYGRGKIRDEKARTAAHPDEPWLWKGDWASGEIRSSSKTMLAVVWGFAIFWNLISLPIALMVLIETKEPWSWPKLLVLVFPAVGMLLLAVALFLLLRWRKYGESVFQMASVPGVVGGKLAGVIRTSARIRPEDGFRVTLSCIRKYTTGSGNSRNTREEVLWQDQQVIARPLAEPDFTQTAIPVVMAIPYEALPSDDSDSDDQILWRLEAAASVPGVDYKALFDVPVFKTAESRPDFRLDESLLAPYAAPVDADRELRAAGVLKSTAPGGATRYEFSMARNPATALVLTLLTAIWSGVVVVLVLVEAPIIFPIVFGLIDLFLVHAALDAWFYCSVVDISPSGLSVSRGLFGLGRTQSIDVAEIDRIELKQGVQAGSTVYYDLVVHRRGRKKIKVARSLPSRRQAQTIVDQWRAAMNR